MKSRTSALHTLTQMDLLHNNGLGNMNSSTAAENEPETNFGGCPVGRPYPWIYEIPKILTQNFTSGITALPTEEVALKVVFYIFTIVVALVSKRIKFLKKSTLDLLLTTYNSLFILNG